MEDLLACTLNESNSPASPSALTAAAQYSSGSWRHTYATDTRATPGTRDIACAMSSVAMPSAAVTRMWPDILLMSATSNDLRALCRFVTSWFSNVERFLPFRPISW